ncbi:LacI family DNA-binding transcriptional regulator, partial [Kineococcus indalonis]|uniref:LacI family DNA-binding transcriptional regulator n=1 Tax=Kineococcus indalonis TaxID=2696566 RepID=UPI001411EE50
MARARLQDVAERAGVSAKTVSNVLRDHPQVRAETRRRVQEAIDELQYRPSALGRRLRTGRTGLIALALPEVDIPYYAELARHVVDAAHERGYTVLIEQTSASLEAERALLDAPEAGLVDGVLLDPVAVSAAELQARHLQTPMVLLGEGPAPEQVDHVGIDDHAAAREATAHLLASGRRRVAFLGVQPGARAATARRRHDGWAAALREAGAAGAPALVAPEFSPDAGARAVRAALAAGRTFDALLCPSDLLAVGAVSALAEAGVPVPEQVAVVGFDDIALAAYTTPALTSVRLDRAAIAATALDLLAERIDGADGPGRRRTTAHRLVVRRSSAPP